MNRTLFGSLAALATAASILSAACGGDDDQPAATPAKAATAAAAKPTEAAAGATKPAVKKEIFDVDKATTTVSGLRYIDQKVGDGAAPTMQQQVTVHYTGKLASDGTKFDSSVDRGAPATFAMTGVIKGFSEAISTMKVGGKRTAFIPAALGYGARAQGPIPANSDLIFEIELISVK